MTILNHKVALVTGATGGLGRSISKKLAENGVHVFLTGRDTKKLKELLEASESYIGAESLDLRDTEKIKDLINRVHPDILVNCAGIFPVQSIEDTTEEIFNETFEVNERERLGQDHQYCIFIGLCWISQYFCILCIQTCFIGTLKVVIS